MKALEATDSTRVSLGVHDSNSQYVKEAVCIQEDLIENQEEILEGKLAGLQPQKVYLEGEPAGLITSRSGSQVMAHRYWTG